MTIEEIREGNKYIADYMNLIVRVFETVTGKKVNRYVALPNPLIMLSVGEEQQLCYHESWDWLMPVVRKCCDELREMGFNPIGTYNPKIGYVSEIYTMRLDNTIEKVWSAVVRHVMRFAKKREEDKKTKSLEDKIVEKLMKDPEVLNAVKELQSPVNRFAIQSDFDKLVLMYGFAYGHTLNSYDHHYYMGDMEIHFNPDEREFSLKWTTENNIHVLAELDGDELTLENVEDRLKNNVEKPWEKILNK
jgi:hypothetical protein